MAMSDINAPSVFEERQPVEPGWSVLRIDDNGNRFIIRAHLRKREAERVAAEFEARGHKQVYWVETDDRAAG